MPTYLIGFFDWPNPSSRIMALGRLRNLPEGEGWTALKADNLTAICEPIF
jgi:hypothetical protein